MRATPKAGKFSKRALCWSVCDRGPIRRNTMAKHHHRRKRAKRTRLDLHGAPLSTHPSTSTLGEKSYEDWKEEARHYHEKPRYVEKAMIVPSRRRWPALAAVRRVGERFESVGSEGGGDNDGDGDKNGDADDADDAGDAGDAGEHNPSLLETLGSLPRRISSAGASLRRGSFRGPPAADRAASRFSTRLDSSASREVAEAAQQQQQQQDRQAPSQNFGLAEMLARRRAKKQNDDETAVETGAAGTGSEELVDTTPRPIISASKSDLRESVVV